MTRRNDLGGVFIFCDACGEATCPEDDAARTADAARTIARGLGWRTGLSGGTDVCKACRTTPEGREFVDR